MIDLVDFLNADTETVHDVILAAGDTTVKVDEIKHKISVEIAMQYAEEETQIYSFVNGIPTPQGGTHFTAFKTGLTRAVRSFAETRNMIKKGNDFTGEDVLLGLTAVVTLRMG